MTPVSSTTGTLQDGSFARQAQVTRAARETTQRLLCVPIPSECRSAQPSPYMALLAGHQREYPAQATAAASAHSLNPAWVERARPAAPHTYTHTHVCVHHTHRDIPSGLAEPEEPDSPPPPPGPLFRDQGVRETVLVSSVCMSDMLLHPGFLLR